MSLTVDWNLILILLLFFKWNFGYLNYGRLHIFDVRWISDGFRKYWQILWQIHGGLNGGSRGRILPIWRWRATRKNGVIPRIYRQRQWSILWSILHPTYWFYPHAEHTRIAHFRKGFLHEINSETNYFKLQSPFRLIENINKLNLCNVLFKKYEFFAST